MKQIPMILMFLVTLLICLGSFALAAYVEVFGPPQLPTPRGETSRTFMLVMIGFITGFIAFFIAAVFSDGDKPKQVPKQK